jgi:hypothetical protein
MTRIFLDFDGVLRRDTSPTSRLDADCIRNFEDAVIPHAGARIVIVSTWRLVHQLDALRRLFPTGLATRIEGVTPDVPDAEEFARHAEVLAYISRNRLHGVRWIAVDDDPQGYRPGAPLIRVDPALGFDKACAQQLGDWLGEAKPAN